MQYSTNIVQKNKMEITSVAEDLKKKFPSEETSIGIRCSKLFVAA